MRCLSQDRSSREPGQTAHAEPDGDDFSNPRHRRQPRFGRLPAPLQPTGPARIPRRQESAWHAYISNGKIRFPGPETPPGATQSMELRLPPARRGYARARHEHGSNLLSGPAAPGSSQCKAASRNPPPGSLRRAPPRVGPECFAHDRVAPTRGQVTALPLPAAELASRIQVKNAHQTERFRNHEPKEKSRAM